MLKQWSVSTKIAPSNLGGFIYGATTDNPDPLANAVIVYNNLSVILSQGDAVDVDGNGLLDDDAFIDVFNNDDGFLTDDQTFYFTADLVDGLGNDLGQAFLTVQVPEPMTSVLLLTGGLVVFGLRRRSWS